MAASGVSFEVANWSVCGPNEWLAPWDYPRHVRSGLSAFEENSAMRERNRPSPRERRRRRSRARAGALTVHRVAALLACGGGRDKLLGPRNEKG
jgi:hypothetical protein